jgi:hypothetical protein
MLTESRRAVKTERLVLLTTPQFKALVTRDAKREGVSVAEFVRRRVEPKATDEERLLQELTAQLQAAVEDTRRSVNDSVTEVQAVLRELRARRSRPKQKAAA